MEKISTIFIGTSEFAVPILQKLLDIDFIDLKAVVTQPDRPVGRKQEMQKTPVKLEILNSKLDIPIETPEKIKKVGKELMGKYNPELIIVASYGQIIPRSILNYPKFGALNIHGSILPKLRGAVPIQMAILQGFEQTGVTLQKMVYEMDEGDVISNSKFRIPNDATYESLSQDLSNLAAENLENDLRNWINGKIDATPQDDAEATYCYISDTAKDKAEITAETSANKAERMVRGFYPWPIAWFKVPNGLQQGKRLKVYRSSINLEKSLVGNFELVKHNGQLALQLQNDLLILEEVQLEGKDKRDGEEYLWLLED